MTATIPMFVAVTQVREYMDLEDTDATSKYSDQTIGSNIRAAAYELERKTGRWFFDRPTATWTGTTNGSASVLIPGFRSVTSVTMQGAGLTENSTFWLVPDAQSSGVYTGLQVRPYGTNRSGPWWLSNPEWFDRNLDSPFYPANRGYGLSSLPNDLVIAGAGGYAEADLPEPVRHANKVLAGFFTLRPTALLSGAQSTPEGNVYDLSRYPIEVQNFIADWRIGQQAASVG